MERKQKIFAIFSIVIALALLGASAVPVLAGGVDKGWAFMAIDGGGQVVTGQNTFHSTAIDITDGVITLTQTYDANFENESSQQTWPATEQYNNAFFIGYQGYQPTSTKDVVWTFNMKIDPGYYGSTGFNIERKGTFAADGTYQGPRFDLFGVSYMGEASFSPSLLCSETMDWNPVMMQPITSVNPFEWNQFQIRFHKLSDTDVQASIKANGVETCSVTIPNFNETEVQIWGDNYAATLDENWNIVIGYGNRLTPQSSHFRGIEVKLENPQ